MEFDKWIHLIYINEKIPLREGRSMHQAKILEILNAIKDHNLDAVLSIRHIPCNADTEIVGYCRYLQYMISDHLNEGKEK